MQITRASFELRVSYTWRVAAMKLSPEKLLLLGSRLLGLVFTYSGRGTYMVKPHPDY